MASRCAATSDSPTSHPRKAPLHLLDNVIWNALSGTQAGFATGEGDARRYARGFSPIVAFREPHTPDFDALAPFCDVGEHFYCDIWSGIPPRGWQVEREARMLRMVWAGAYAKQGADDAAAPADASTSTSTQTIADLEPPPDPAPDAVPLDARHAAQAVELATLTNPGPFGLRTIELGDYFGYFDGDRLIAMAGERMAADTLREISGVCTHPDYQGKGLARRLTQKLLQRQLARGQIPFLHVMSANTTARGLYERMGFLSHLESTVRIISML